MNQNRVVPLYEPETYEQKEIRRLAEQLRLANIDAANESARANDAEEQLRVAREALVSAQSVGEIHFRTCILASDVADKIEKALAITQEEK